MKGHISTVLFRKIGSDILMISKSLYKGSDFRCSIRGHISNSNSGVKFQMDHFLKNLPRWRSGAQMGKKLLAVDFLEEPIELFVDNMKNRI